MDSTIVYVDRSDIRPGRLDEVKAAISALVELVEQREPQLIAYSIYVEDDGKGMSVVAVHSDATSMELHMVVGAPGFRRFAGLIDLRSIDVYGAPSDLTRRQLKEKADMLGSSVRVTVHEPHAGLSRNAGSAARR